MIAEDYADSESSAGAIYRIIRQRLLNTSRDNMLPVVYVIDSILKNVKGFYLNILEKDAIDWMPIVFQQLHETQRVKLEKVWKTWDEFKLFPLESWKAIGRCFGDRSSVPNTAIVSTVSEVAGISRTVRILPLFHDVTFLHNALPFFVFKNFSSCKSTAVLTIIPLNHLRTQKDGTLVLPGNLRKEMQSILDEIQSGIQNELEKVSLERLADLDPGLLGRIKTTAEESMRASRGQVNTTKQQEAANCDNEQPRLPAFFTETRSPQVLKTSKEWKEIKNWPPLEQTHEVIKKLQKSVMDGGASDSGNRYTREEALQMTRYYAIASATTTLLIDALERIQKQDEQQKVNRSTLVSQRKNQMAVSGGSFAVNKDDFTNEGIKKKNEAVVGLLYEIGLPYISSADGRRFRTQIDLSKHLDALFKRNQLEKSMARTEERGWYVSDPIWTRIVSDEEDRNDLDSNEIDAGNAVSDIDQNEGNTVPADEARDRCVICGINFKMFFDNDDGIYKYSNCKEIEVINDDAAETESEHMLVHVTCWKGLGSPEVLTMDQTLQEDS